MATTTSWLRPKTTSRLKSTPSDPSGSRFRSNRLSGIRNNHIESSLKEFRREFRAHRLPIFSNRSCGE